MMKTRVCLQRPQPHGSSEWLEFLRPVKTLSAEKLSEVRPLLEQVSEVSKTGLHAAGWVSYEASPAFDNLQTHTTPTRPLAWFTFFEERISHEAFPFTANAPYDFETLQPSWDEEAFCQRVEQIKQWIAQGQTYQVNLTFPLNAHFSGSPASLASRVFSGQQAQHAAYIEYDDWVVISASPELFFEWNPPQIRCRPMKGTAPRSGGNDTQEVTRLRTSAKNQSENVMIVDMVRNDLGRIAEAGTVTVPSLYDIETYPTLFQMTSSVEARTSATLPEVFDALFPCASVTGAPKVRTMELIHKLEDVPRGVYTGSVGYVEPGGEVHFNVAIRTAEIDRQKNKLTYSVGAGIVWDSDPHDEYLECMTKARVLQGAYPDLQLLESLRWEPETGYFLLEEHLHRLETSASYFGFSTPPANIEEQLKQATANQNSVLKVRLLMTPAGEISIETSPLATGETTWHVAIDSEPISSTDIFLQHKTTRRHRYEAARARHTDCMDVLLYNERDEWTESCFANLALCVNDQWFTPPCSAGLLSGTYRQHLLQQGKLQEKVLYKDDLHKADKVALINSVRKWINVNLITS